MGIFTILLMVFCSGYYYALTERGVSLTVLLLSGYCLMICMWYVYSRKKLVLTQNECFFTLGSLCAILFSALWNRSFSISEIKQLLIVVCALLIASTYKWETFKKRYIKIMDIILILSLIGFVLCLTGVMRYFPTVTNYNGVKYYSAILFSAITYPFSGITKRMHGLFWEPGLLASYILFAMLLLERDTSKKKYIWHMVFYSTCILVSSSGAGILLMPAVWVIKLLEDNGRKYTSKRVVSLAMLFVVGLGVLALNIDNLVQNEWLSTILFDKIMNPEHANTSSRLNAVAVDLDIAISNLPFGVGLSRYSEVLQWYDNHSSGTSTLTMMIAQYGVPAIILVTILLIGICRMDRSKVWYVKAMYLIVFIAIISKEPHNNLLFFNTLAMYAVGLIEVKQSINVPNRLK